MAVLSRRLAPLLPALLAACAGVRADPADGVRRLLLATAPDDPDPLADPLADQAGWVAWTSPGGLALRHPPGWTAAARPERNWVELRGTGGERLVIGPVLVPGVPDEAAAGAALLRLARHVTGRPEAGWAPPRAEGRGRVGTGAPTADGRDWTLASLSWRQAPGGAGAAALFTLRSEPQHGFPRRQAVLAAVLDSVAPPRSLAPAALP
ncbi:hypothetical protein M0638_13100 [Roseomonas sp. NAR14]|uniref:Lipoprotein n=1 Tax=Roseomonas acroporae TaxID=2937791 RepID=A0A9X2BUA9_9PROT|nr:hypothetical protein [Roseomonas acroporae]MCK8785322.1 hypothetical protein [Roseomonas acroporae]